MPRGGLSSDPEKAARQLAPLKKNWPNRGRKAGGSGGSEPDSARKQGDVKRPQKGGSGGGRPALEYPDDAPEPKDDPGGQDPAEPRESAGGGAEREPERRRGGFLDGLRGRY